MAFSWVRIVNVQAYRQPSTDIYFRQKNASEHHAALELRDAVLRLCRDGAFVAVPLFRVNTEPMGPHPVGKPPFRVSFLGMYLVNFLSKVPTKFGSPQRASPPYSRSSH